MGLPYIIAELQATLRREELHRKRHRYQREEATLQRVRSDLENGDREQWVQETRETAKILG